MEKFIGKINLHVELKGGKWHNGRSRQEAGEGTMKHQKKNLRSQIRKKAAELPEAYCTSADEGIGRYVMSLAEYQKAKTVFCYVGAKREINTRPILEKILRDGKRLGVPKCIEEGIMEVREIDSFECLEEGAYGIPEPKAFCVCIRPEEIDLALIPCLSCSHDGKRLGYGGGYYDRYLERADFTKVVLCRERLTEEEIPMDSLDTTMDIVVTENGIWRI